ncbi:MAG: thiol-disulfide oxidoreductase DCC family protein [Blastopirellula sp. JB062]
MFTTPQSEKPELVSPTEAPGRDVVIYDGNCRFCTQGVRWINFLGGKRRLSYLSLHDPTVAEHAPDLSHDQLMEEMFVIEPSGRRHAGAEAFRYLTRKLPALWIFAPFLHIPYSLPIWSWGYRQFARIRYRFGTNACDGDSCKIHFD